MVYEAKKKILQGTLTVPPMPLRKRMTNSISSSLRKRRNWEETIQSCSCPDCSPWQRSTSSRGGSKRQRSTLTLLTGVSSRTTTGSLPRRRRKRGFY
jgi:hypothetical protein